MLPSPHPLLASVEPYAPGEQPSESGFVKLNTNEFPYEAAPAVLEAIRREATDAVRLYPSPRCDRLRESLARLHGTTPDRILVGNGSDEILRLLIQAYGGAGRRAALVDPSYSLYPTLLQAVGCAFDVHPLDDLVGLPESAFRARADLALLPVPNAPIGNVFPYADLERLADAHSLLALDEAYADFADEPARNLRLALERDDAAVCRTFSKSFGLAGLRVGYVVAHPAIVAELSKIADSYNVNRISQAAAIAAVESIEHYRALGERIRRDRDRLAEDLRARDFEVFPSQANFLFARRADARSLYEKLKARKILVRHFARPRLEDGIRITIGRTDEIRVLLEAIDAIGRG